MRSRRFVGSGVFFNTIHQYSLDTAENAFEEELLLKIARRLSRRDHVVNSFGEK